MPSKKMIKEELGLALAICKELQNVSVPVHGLDTEAAAELKLKVAGYSTRFKSFVADYPFGWTSTDRKTDLKRYDPELDNWVPLYSKSGRYWFITCEELLAAKAVADNPARKALVSKLVAHHKQE